MLFWTTSFNLESKSYEGLLYKGYVKSILQENSVSQLMFARYMGLRVRNKIGNAVSLPGLVLHLTKKHITGSWYLDKKKKSWMKWYYTDLTHPPDLLHISRNCTIISASSGTVRDCCLCFYWHFILELVITGHQRSWMNFVKCLESFN